MVLMYRDQPVLAERDIAAGVFETLNSGSVALALMSVACAEITATSSV
jgi:hypothetical protein